MIQREALHESISRAASRVSGLLRRVAGEVKWKTNLHQASWKTGQPERTQIMDDFGRYFMQVIL